ncbi:hypothetical protein BDV28DRAFT_155027 [Aspergillus coremiiformis]|uniref:Methyltransferase domain-containing protein n=1 Tax=Aspergillus coremiiformis TaxID=138285 RepID=A0A5N6ZE07_9EURO|nr:hypothetical protein BDV28DRAFT_155027 [Aspergillus coremiiformis]
MSDRKEHHGPFHNSAYEAEYCDLRAKAHATSRDTQGDAEIYLSALKNQQETYSPLDHHGEHVVVLDVGTGTGRVLVNLANDADTHDLPLTNVEFIGVDKEPAMIHRAVVAQRETQSMLQLSRIDWLVGEALHLTSAELLENRINQVDLLLFAGGSVSHLIGPDEPLGFFAQAAALLRPRSGRFYLAVRDDLISTRSITRHMEHFEPSVEVHDRRDFPSQLYEGVVYRELSMGQSEVDGSIKTDRYRLQVVKQADTGGEAIIEDHLMNIVLRMWKESELLEWFKKAGLECVETLHASHETYYVLKQAG